MDGVHNDTLLRTGRPSIDAAFGVALRGAAARVYDLNKSSSVSILETADGVHMPSTFVVAGLALDWLGDHVITAAVVAALARLAAVLCSQCVGSVETEVLGAQKAVDSMERRGLADIAEDDFFLGAAVGIEVNEVACATAKGSEDGDHIFGLLATELPI
jgi:hypothetical protein